MMKEMIKRIVEKCVTFYSNAYRYKNERFHGPGKGRLHATNWCNRLVQEIENRNRSKMKKY